MSRKVYVDLTVRLVLHLDDGVEVSDALAEMSSSYHLEPEHGHVEDDELLGYDVMDSK